MKQNLGERVFQESELTLCFKNCQRIFFLRKTEYSSVSVLMIVVVSCKKGSNWATKVHMFTPKKQKPSSTPTEKKGSELEERLRHNRND